MAYRSLLARSPTELEHCEDVVSLSTSVPFSITNLVISISIPLEQQDGHSLEHLAVLNCTSGRSGLSYAIRVRRLSSGSNQYMRVHSNVVYESHGKTRRSATQLFVPERLPLALVESSSVAIFQYSMRTLDCPLRAIWTETSRKTGEDITRFGTEEIEQTECHMIRMLFESSGSHRRTRRLIVVAYNPHLHSITVKAGVLHLTSFVIYPHSYLGSVGVPNSRYNIADMAITRNDRLGNEGRARIICNAIKEHSGRRFGAHCLNLCKQVFTAQSPQNERSG